MKITHKSLDSIQVDVEIQSTPKLRKQVGTAIKHKAIPSGIKRTRKRQIAKAKFMDKGSYEYSQYWRKKYGKFRRNATRYSKRGGQNND